MERRQARVQGLNMQDILVGPLAGYHIVQTNRVIDGLWSETSGVNNDLLWSWLVADHDSVDVRDQI